VRKEAALRRLVNRLLPESLGKGFRTLWLSSTISNLGDGIVLAAGPLLVASVTRAPFAVAMAVLAQRLPWLLFGVFAGAVIDRLDRRRLMIAVDVFRAVVFAGLGLAVAAGNANLAVIYGAMFLVGTAETLADNAGSVMVAVVVPRSALGQANARLFGASTVMNQLLGPPLGAFVFGIGIALPFGLNAVCFVAAAALISRLHITPTSEDGRGARSLRREVAEGLRWLWSHTPIRTLAIMITVFNVTFGAAFSVWVLYAFERLGLDEVGFGLLMTAVAIGGLVGSAAFHALERRFTYTTLLRAGLIVETLTHVVLASTRRPLVAAAVMTALGVHAVVWGTTSTTVRQRAVPDRLLGRVTSVYMIGSVGALALGTLIGGVVAQRWGVLAPFWFAGAGAAVTTALIWRSLVNVGRAADTGLAD
jgi:predicted MFS family arabinose efflux permease